MKKITLKEIAKLAGVSQQTASAVLSKNKNDNTRFSEKTATNVEKIADEYNYRPNRCLRTVFEKKHRAIAILFKILDVMGKEEINSVLNSVSETGQKVILDKIKENEKLPKCIKEDIADGLLIFEDLGEEIDKAIDKYQIPAVYVNANMYNCKSPTVNMDEKEAMVTALEIFLQSGKKHPLLLLQGNKKNSFNRLRIEGIRTACKNNKLPAPFFLEILENPGGIGFIKYRKLVIEKIQNIISKHPEIDSIISVFRDTTISVYQACEMMNKSIPNDIAVISLFNVVKEWMLKPMITCLDIDRKQMAKEGVELLQKAINREKCENIILKYKVLSGKSV